MTRHRFVVYGFLAALLIAGVLSYYASGHPDGLEFVAEQSGFLETARDSAVAESPLADYQTKGIGDDRLSGGLAGVVGTVVVAGLSGTLFWMLRRRAKAR